MQAQNGQVDSTYTRKSEVKQNNVNILAWQRGGTPC